MECPFFIVRPAIGASQKSQSWATAQSPKKTATPVLRAGFTEVLVMTTSILHPGRKEFPQAFPGFLSAAT
jgi:hypothetical protein